MAKRVSSIYGNALFELAVEEKKMKSQEAQSQENEKWRKRVEIAEQLYEKLKKDFTEKEKKTFVELNTKIQDNFQRMFKVS